MNLDNWFDGLESDLDAKAVPVQATAKDYNSWQSPNGSTVAFTGKIHSGHAIEAKPEMYRENCKKCRNGNFVSYSGRIVGRCFACKGVGYFERKTSPEVRAAAKAARVEKANNETNNNLESFKAAYPEIYDWAFSNCNSFEFAGAMVLAITKYGTLTEKQLAACQKCIDSRKAAKAQFEARKVNAPLVETDKLMDAFNNASRNGLQRPKLRFETFEASLAPVTGKNAGAVYIKRGEVYLGKIQTGKFFASRDCSEQQIANVKDAMNDPLQAAIAYGKRIGSCSCCGRTLTDKVSIERGIGPICESKFGF